MRISMFRGALVGVLSSALLASCAQILDTDQFRVDPEAFESDDSTDDGGADSGGPAVTDEDDTDDRPTDDDPDPAPDPSLPDPEPPEAGPGPLPTSEPPDAGPDPTVAPTIPVVPGAGGSLPIDDDGGRGKPQGGAGGAGGAGGGSTLPPGCVPAVSGECDTRTQCGCDPGEMCRVVDLTTGETGCSPAGDTEPYAACLNNTDCQAGYACIASVCKQICDSETTDTCAQGPYATCQQVTYDGADVPGFSICLRTCDPLDSSNDTGPYDPCGAGASCIPGRAGVSYCIAAGTGVEDDPCETAAGDPDPFACADGYSCVIKAEGSVCKQNCDVTQGTCSGGNTCFGYVTPVGAAEVEIGYCDSCPSLPPNGTCDPVSQCGCSDTEMCAVVDFATGETGCIAPGATPTGGACTPTVGQCEPGSECLHWIDTGVCSLFCNDDADCASGACAEWEIPGVKLCLHGCDPRSPQSNADGFQPCAATQSCTIWENVPDSSVCVVPIEAGQLDAPCGDDDECAPGLSCALVDDTRLCRKWCELGSDDCPAGEACLAHTRISGELEVANVSYGICTEPLVELGNDTQLAIPDSVGEEPGCTTSAVTLTAPPAGINYIQVEVDVTHPWIGDVDVYLLGPDLDTFVWVHSGDVFTGTALASADNFRNTVFGDDANTLITAGLAPFTGFFQTYEPLSAFVDLHQTQAAWAGEWTLYACDLSEGDEGTLDSWKIRFY